MKILFLDQSGKPGGAELCLIDIAKPYKNNCLVGLFADGDFKDLLKKNQIPVEILTTQSIEVRKESSFFKALSSTRQILPLIFKVAKIARQYDVIYANTQKALVVGAIASALTGRSLVYHLHDILSPQHFSSTNRRIAVSLANRFASLVIANSQASKSAFIEAGGSEKIISVIYNGFDTKIYQKDDSNIAEIKRELGVRPRFIIGNFSRLSPWKGQHILLAALAQCPSEVTVIFVGDALFGEQEYVAQLHQQVKDLGLEDRVKFLGFRSDIPELMAACNLVTHTSTAAEPFGRVIVEAMLSGKPVIATKAGGAIELVEDGVNGFLVTPGDSLELAKVINKCYHQVEETQKIGEYAKTIASERFDVDKINQEIGQLLAKLIS
jgi:glycosyltransferase involved in cell wall biosynthesis